jgi:hypothetical protein
MTFITCERCGFEAKNMARLLIHWRGERQCPALHSKTTHQQLIERYKPATPIEALTCSQCNKVCKTIGGLKIHFKRCNQNEKSLGTSQETQASTSQQESTPVAIKRLSDLPGRRIDPYKDVYKNSSLKSFIKDIEWSLLGLDKTFLLECCVKTKEGIVDLFITLHNVADYENIKWYFDEKLMTHKLIIYDGKKWIDANDKHFRCHLGHIYSYLEEFWCDYQMDIRCKNILLDNVLSQHTRDIVEEFFYETIVDDESVMFHCRDLVGEYLEAIKTVN